jgi:hypothetical protein
MRHFYPASLAIAPAIFACSHFLVLGPDADRDIHDSYSTDLLPLFHKFSASSEANDRR